MLQIQVCLRYPHFSSYLTKYNQQYFSNFSFLKLLFSFFLFNLISIILRHTSTMVILLVYKTLIRCCARDLDVAHFNYTAYISKCVYLISHFKNKKCYFPDGWNNLFSLSFAFAYHFCLWTLKNQKFGFTIWKFPCILFAYMIYFVICSH